MIKIEKIKELGWKYDSCWNNRNIYSIGEYSLFEHNGSLGILDTVGNFIYHEPTDEQLEQYTKLAKALTTMKEHPEDFTLKQFKDAILAMKSVIYYIQENSNEEDDDED